MGETLDEARLHWLPDCDESHWNDARGGLCGPTGRCRGGDDYIHLALNEFGHELRKAFVVAIRPAWLKHHVITFDIAEFTKALAARFPEVFAFDRDERKHVTDSWNLPRMLRSSTEGPCG